MIQAILYLRDLCLKALADVAALREENAALRKENAALREENTALRKDNAALREENASLGAHNAIRGEAFLAQSLEFNANTRHFQAERRDLLLRFQQMSDENSVLLGEMELQKRLISDLLQSLQQAQTEHEWLMTLQNPYDWMLSNRIHEPLADLTECLLAHQVIKAECREHEVELPTLQYLIKEAMQEERDPKDLLERQGFITKKMQENHLKRDDFTISIERNLKRIFEALTNTADE
jgi:hypothetical protein